MKRRRIQWWASVSLALLVMNLLAGCSLFAGKPNPPPLVDDRGIETRIQDQLAQDPSVKGAHLSVQSAGGIVEITGSVTSVAAKSRAGLIAASVQGVVQVKNDSRVNAAP